MNKIPRLVLIFLALILIIGGAFASISPLIEFSKRNLLGWKKTSAEVSGYSPIVTDNGDKNYVAILSYQVENSRYELSRNNGKKIPSFDETTTVYYNPKKIDEAVFGEYAIWNLAILIFPICGVVILFLNIFDRKRQLGFETEEDNIKTISKIQNSEVRLLGKIVNVESRVSPSGMNVGVAIVSAKLPDGKLKHFRSEQIEGLTAGLLVSYLANPSPISVSVRNGNYDDYYIENEEILAAIRKSFDTVRQINLKGDKDV